MSFGVSRCPPTFSVSSGEYTVPFVAADQRDCISLTVLGCLSAELFTIVMATPADVDIFVGNNTIVDPEVYQLWLEGYTGE